MAETTISSSSERSGTGSGGRTAAQVLADLEEQRRNADQRIRPAVEAQRREAQEMAEKALDSEAIAAVQQTERALVALAENRTDEALAAIEQATGKINILLSRNPSTALIPVDVRVLLIDSAPQSIDEITALKDAAEMAVDISDLPSARTLLDSLRSEIRRRTYHVPLASYPAALQAAAQLIDQKQTEDAAMVLLMALNALAIIDQVTALPLLLARQAINDAHAKVQTDKEAAEKLVDLADHEIERAMELGYTPEDVSYSSLREEIRNVRKQLKGNEDSNSVFTRIKEKLAALTKRQSSNEKRSDAQKQPKAA